MSEARSSSARAPLGLIAGEGELPLEVARAARAAGQVVHAIAFVGMTSGELEGVVDSLVWLHLGEFEKLIDRLGRCGARQAVMAGKVSKQHLYGDIATLRPDARALAVYARIADRRDGSILAAIADELGREGVVLRSQLDFCAALTAKPGVLGASRPDDRQWADIRLGWPIARAVGALDIGQSVVVEAGAVLAVEAIEGTDQAVRRGGSLGSGRASLIKLAKPGQDPRFDLPTVGPRTLRAMCESGVDVLAFEAHCTIILERESLIRTADAEGIAVVSLEGDRDEFTHPR